MGYSTILVSADVMNDGRVSIMESSSAFATNTNGEREAFAGCLAKYKKAS